MNDRDVEFAENEPPSCCHNKRRTSYQRPDTFSVCSTAEPQMWHLLNQQRGVTWRISGKKSLKCESVQVWSIDIYSLQTMTRRAKTSHTCSRPAAHTNMQPRFIQRSTQFSLSIPVFTQQLRVTCWRGLSMHTRTQTEKWSDRHILLISGWVHVFSARIMFPGNIVSCAWSPTFMYSMTIIRS